MSTFADRAPDRSSADVVAPGTAGGGTPDEQRAVDPARRAMIDSQLRTSGINEPWILAAMMRVAREDFVPPAMRDAAYIDRAIPLANGRSLAAPLVQGRMLSEAGPRADDTVLLVGDGAGYLAALLRPLVASLDAIDPATVAKPLDASGAPARAAHYSLIVVDGAVEQLPPELVAGLRDDGRVVTGLVERGVTRIAVGRKTGGTVALLPLAEMGIPVLPEFAAPKHWKF